jgi:hypothetical protein
MGQHNRAVLTAAISAPRTWTLPPANGANRGWKLNILDAGYITKTNTLTIATAGADTINSYPLGPVHSMVLDYPYASIGFVTDGVSQWTVEGSNRSNTTRTRFWTDVNNTYTAPVGAVPIRERVFIGAAVDYSDLNVFADTATFGWLTVNTGPWYLPRDSNLAVLAEDGNTAISGASMSSTGAAATAPAAPIGVGGFAHVDTVGSSGYAFYGEAILNHAGATAVGMELDVRNCTPLLGQPTPYGVGDGPHGLFLACGPGGNQGTGGYGPAPTDNSGAAIVVLQNSTGSNGYFFTKGIVFTATGLYGSNGVDGDAGQSSAIEMARGQEIKWYASNGVAKVSMLSQLNSTDVDWDMVWSGSNMAIARNGAAENVLLLVGTPSAVNYIRIDNEATGVSPIISAQGSDADINLALTPKGAGDVRSAASIHAQASTSIPAAGTAGAGLLLSSVTNFGVFFGSGAPSLSAAKGSLYLRSDGSGVNDRMYVNTNGSTAWTAVVTVA